jgi:hypothetical protein
MRLFAGVIYHEGIAAHKKGGVDDLGKLQQ